jgi:hypothetical protein
MSCQAMEEPEVHISRETHMGLQVYDTLEKAKQ